VTGIAALRATGTPYVLSIFRIVVALLYLEHGLSKVFGFPAPGPAFAWFSLIGLAALLETVGSLAVLVGAATVPVAFLLSGEMAVAYFMAHAPHSFYPLVNHGEAAVFYCFAFLLLAFQGGGPWSVDALCRCSRGSSNS
jgi:putative oxidoreductase